VPPRPRAPRATTTSGAIVNASGRGAGLNGEAEAVTRGRVLKEAWAPGPRPETHYLRVYMAQLRRKIEVEPARQRLLQTEPGIGYRMREATA
jgi:two-component system, OmpR family, KDP operon response regulator KdpE